MTAQPDDAYSYAFIDDGPGDAEALADTLLALAEQVTKAFDCSECTIYELLTDRPALRVQAIWSRRRDERDGDWIGQVHDLGAIPDFEHIVTQREVVAAYRDEEQVSDPTSPASLAYWGEIAALWTPIIYDDDVYGILELVEHEHQRRFTAQEQRLAGQLGAVAGIALRSARQSRIAAARNRQLTALIDASRAISSTLDLDKVLDTVCRQAAFALETPSSYIYEYVPDIEATIWLAQYQRDANQVFDDPIGSTYPLADYPQDAAVVATHRPLQVNLDDPGLDPEVRDQLIGWGECACLTVPLIVGDTIQGLLEVSDTAAQRRFSEEETALCTALGEQAAMAINNAKQFRRLQDQKQIIELQASTDGLTGLANHRTFFERLHDEIRRSQRYGFAVSVLMIDLDDFKSLNDRHGHPAGDAALRGVADVLRRELREGIDTAARYGGEEFAVILPHAKQAGDALSPTDSEGAAATGERIRWAISALDLELAKGTGPTNVTASIGIATLPAQAQDATELVSKADRALYVAKQQGKDRVEVYS